MDGFEKTTAFAIYNSASEALGFIALTAVMLSIIFLGRAIWGWRTPARNRRLKTSAISFLVFPLTIGIHQALLYYYFLPSLGAWQQRLIDQGHEQGSKISIPARSHPSLRGLGVLRGKILILSSRSTTPMREMLPLKLSSVPTHSPRSVE